MLGMLVVAARGMRAVLGRGMRAAQVPGMLAAIALAGCGGQPRNAAPSAGAVAAALQGSPAPLAALHRQASSLLGGGPAAFRARLRALHGYPVVVNEWASWCGPCRSEFPAYQRAAVSYGRRVAFLGLDTQDHNQAAASFLSELPVTYPSYVDPRQSIASTLNLAAYYPQTLYFDQSGRMVYDKAGAYVNAGALDQDIRRYLLQR